MTLSPGWAENLSAETIRNTVKLGDGHTLFEPSAYLEAGLPEEVVDHLKETHVSKRTSSYRAIEAIAEGIKGLIDESDHGMLAGDIDEEGWAEELVAQLMCKDIHEVSAWCPKGTIFRDGQIVEEMEAVYGLNVIIALANDLGLEYDSKMGRGFQYDAAAKSVFAWLDKREG